MIFECLRNTANPNAFQRIVLSKKFIPSATSTEYFKGRFTIWNLTSTLTLILPLALTLTLTLTLTFQL